LEEEQHQQAAGEVEKVRNIVKRYFYVMTSLMEKNPYEIAQKFHIIVSV